MIFKNGYYCLIAGLPELAWDNRKMPLTVEEFREEGKLSGEMSECIRPTDILHFLHCESGERMAEAARRGKLYKEQPFVLGVDASEIYPGDRSGETILVQGIIDVFFEEEGVHSRDRYLRYYLTVYCAFAQAQSENASRNIRWGIEHSFMDGTSGYAEFVCFGYKRDKDGALCPDEPNASIVRRMFEMRAAGASLGAISDWLYRQGVPSPRGKERWSRETIKKLLQNEKYIGSVILQKTYVQDLFSRKQCKNMGEKQRYLYQYAHPAIISQELFEKLNPAIYAAMNCNPGEADVPDEKEEGSQP